MAVSGPVVERSLALLPSSVSGPVAARNLATVPSEFAGPVVERQLAVFPGEWSGPVVERLVTFFTPAFPAGPVVERLFEPAPPPTPSGPVAERSLALLPGAVSGPVAERLLSTVQAPPASPSTGAAPGILVVPPTQPPDITGISPILTNEGLTIPQRRAQLAKENEFKNLRVSARIATQRYTGPAYPFGPSVNGTLGPKDDFSVVVTSMINILTTPRGSVVYDPEIGSDVPLLIFEVLDEITLNLIRYYTRKDLTEQEPRMTVRQVFAQVDPADPNRVHVNVGFSLVGDPDGSIYGIPVVFTQETVGGI